MKRAVKQKSQKRRRKNNVSVWLDDDEARDVESAATRAGDFTSTWGRKVMLRAAREAP